MEELKKDIIQGEKKQEGSTQADERTKEPEHEEDRKEYVERKRWPFLGLPFTFTKYTVTDEVITINDGLLNTKENDCYLYKVQDVELQISLAERIFKLGTVACYTGDNTHPQLYLSHIKHAKEIKNYILKASEEARRRRRTLNTLNIDAADIDDIDA
ncbi:MAG: PH domain-containing protein [Lachnospiraceae bacterium]|nr:PH domain-containing protein [Lachnospiraceae bacterium]